MQNLDRKINEFISNQNYSIERKEHLNEIKKQLELLSVQRNNINAPLIKFLEFLREVLNDKPQYFNSIQLIETSQKIINFKKSQNYQLFSFEKLTTAFETIANRITEKSLLRGLTETLKIDLDFISRQDIKKEMAEEHYRSMINRIKPILELISKINKEDLKYFNDEVKRIHELSADLIIELKKKGI